MQSQPKQDCRACSLRHRFVNRIHEADCLLTQTEPRFEYLVVCRAANMYRLLVFLILASASQVAVCKYKTVFVCPCHT